MDAPDRQPRRFLQFVNVLEPTLDLVDVPQPEPESVAVREELPSPEFGGASRKRRGKTWSLNSSAGGGQVLGPVTAKRASIIVEEETVLQSPAMAGHHARDLVFDGSENTA